MAVSGAACLRIFRASRLIASLPTSCHIFSHLLFHLLDNASLLVPLPHDALRAGAPARSLCARHAFC